MEFKQWQQALKEARQNTLNIHDELHRLRQELINVQREKDQFHRHSDSQNTEQLQHLHSLNDKEQKLKIAIKDQIDKHTTSVKVETDYLKEFQVFADPRANIKELDVEYPILLLPLRLETRFKEVTKPGSTAPTPQLWIRVFPDDVAIDSFESTLSKNEVRNAKSYWQALWKAADNISEQRGAWRSLVANHGSGRAYWITQSYRPRNDSERSISREKNQVILVISTEKPLAKDEREIVENFWETWWRNTGNVINLEEARQDLINKLGASRAQEIMTQYAPFNLTDFPPPDYHYKTAKVSIVFIEFPDSNELEIRLQSWSVPPAVNVMPERLVVQGFYKGTLELKKEISEPIASQLIVGPDPSLEEGVAMRLKGDELVVNDAMKWMIDFDEAVKKGMGFKIDLEPEQAVRGFDRLFVLGVRMSANENEGQKLLEDLLDHHHYSRKGLSILSQGTPTNNTDKAAAGYHWQEDSDVSFNHYFMPTSSNSASPAWTQRTDGQWLAECLGIDVAKIKGIENFTATEHTDAKAMNIALWPATLGYFMESMMSPVFSEEVIQQTRTFFTHYVTGRGTIPAIRLGNQPYGILPTTKFSRMDWLWQISNQFMDTTEENEFVTVRFLFQLYGVLKEIDKTWGEQSKNVSHVGKSGDAHQILLDILSLHPNSVEMHSRYAQSIEHLYNYYNLIGLSLFQSGKFSPTEYTQSGLEVLEKHGYRADSPSGIPDILTKFFFGKTDRLTGRLVDDMPLSETESLREQNGQKNYIQWLIEAAKNSHDTLRQQKGFNGNAPPTSLLYLLLQHALDLSYINSSLQLHQTRGLMTPDQVITAKMEPRFIHIEEETDKGSRWQHIYKREPAITGSASLQISEYIPTQLGKAEETRQLEDMLEALEHLQLHPTAKLERTLVEHLDTCAYRYDAWMQGLVNYQLQLMRGINPNADSKPKQGIYLGAYGWLEEVRPKNRKLDSISLEEELKDKFQREGDAPLVKDSDNAGYVFAPSLNHAVTAAVLRNGYISHRSSPSAKPFAINLSSERVRLALNIIQGMRAGQNLAALLGYQLERGLHDRHDVEIDKFILDLRLAFPFQANQMQSTHIEESQSDELKSIEQIEARNVINGLQLIEHIERTGNRRYPFGKDLPPLKAATQGEAINAEVERIIDLNDAVADLAMAEGVHQAVQGNYDRAAAVLDSYSKGHLPPIPDVIQTPRNGIAITHRVGLQFKTELSPSDPKNITPRSKAEPALNDWLSSVLPDMSNIVCSVEYYLDHDHPPHKKTVPITMADLKLQPIDLLYLINTSSVQAMTAIDDIIHSYVIKAFSLRPDAALTILYTMTENKKVTLFEIAPLIDSLRALVLQSRHLNAGDIKLANEAKKNEETELSLNPERITLLVNELTEIASPNLPASPPLQIILDKISPLIASKDIDGLITEIDTFIDDLSSIFTKVGRFGLQQTGTGFLYDWQRRIFLALREKVNVLSERLQQRLNDYRKLIADYPKAATPEEKYKLLQQAERLIATTSTFPLPSPDDYHKQLENIKRPAYEEQLGRIYAFITRNAVSSLFQGIAAEQPTLGDFDLIGIDITDERSQVLVFASDIRTSAENLQNDLIQRLADVDALLTEHDTTASSNKKMQLISDAARKLLHEDFKLIPEFKPTTEHAEEWHNAANDSEKLLRYLQTDKEIDFPIDDWLYGMARVRGKMHHLENATLLIEGLEASNLGLQAMQFPYRQYDYWLALPYPDKIAENGNPFVIEEDKLLYTAIYAEPFDKTKSQCGLLLDEWTEVIPLREVTTGLTFHFDQPNTEPPQTLLLVTPSEFSGKWQWEDLVGTLGETLDMAKKRAVEPDNQLDNTPYSRFLPALISAVTAYPITAALKLAINNEYYSKAAENE